MECAEKGKNGKKKKIQKKRKMTRKEREWKRGTPIKGGEKVIHG